MKINKLNTYTPAAIGWLVIHLHIPPICCWLPLPFVLAASVLSLPGQGGRRKKKMKFKFLIFKLFSAFFPFQNGREGRCVAGAFLFACLHLFFGHFKDFLFFGRLAFK